MPNNFLKLSTLCLFAAAYTLAAPAPVWQSRITAQVLAPELKAGENLSAAYLVMDTVLENILSQVNLSKQPEAEASAVPQGFEVFGGEEDEDGDASILRVKYDPQEAARLRLLLPAGLLEVMDFVAGIPENGKKIVVPAQMAAAAEKALNEEIDVDTRAWLGNEMEQPRLIAYEFCVLIFLNSKYPWLFTPQSFYRLWFKIIKKTRIVENFNNANAGLEYGRTYIQGFSGWQLYRTIAHEFGHNALKLRFPHSGKSLRLRALGELCADLTAGALFEAGGALGLRLRDIVGHEKAAYLERGKKIYAEQHEFSVNQIFHLNRVPGFSCAVYLQSLFDDLERRKGSFKPRRRIISPRLMEDEETLKLIPAHTLTLLASA